MRTIRSSVFPSVHRDMNSYERFSTGILYLSNRVFFSDFCATLIISTSSLPMIMNAGNDPKITRQIRVCSLPSSLMRSYGGDNSWGLSSNRTGFVASLRRRMPITFNYYSYGCLCWICGLWFVKLPRIPELLIFYTQSHTCNTFLRNDRWYLKYDSFLKFSQRGRIERYR